MKKNKNHKLEDLNNNNLEETLKFIFPKSQKKISLQKKMENFFKKMNSIRI